MFFKRDTGGRKLKRSYFEDIRLLKTNFARVNFCALLVLLGALPFLIPGFYIYRINLLAIYFLVAIGLNILVGYTGQISLGHAGFFAIGAYTSVILMTRLNMPFMASLVIAGSISAVFGFLLGLPALRLKGPYLAIATLGFGMSVTTIIGHWEFFGGRMGIQTPKPSIFGFELGSDKEMYFLISTITVLMTLIAVNLMKTRIGRALVAIRDNDIAASAMGVNLTYYKTLAFAISAFYTGIAGSIMAHMVGFINPDSFNLILSITFLAMVVVGGLSSILGSFMGAVFTIFITLFLPEILDDLFVLTPGMQNIPTILYGLVMILIIIFEPFGLRGLYLRSKIYFKTWPF